MNLCWTISLENKNLLINKIEIDFHSGSLMPDVASFSRWSTKAIELDAVPSFTCSKREGGSRAAAAVPGSHQDLRRAGIVRKRQRPPRRQQTRRYIQRRRMISTRGRPQGWWIRFSRTAIWLIIGTYLSLSFINMPTDVISIPEGIFRIENPVGISNLIFYMSVAEFRPTDGFN